MSLIVGRRSYAPGAASKDEATFRGWGDDEDIRVGAFCSFSAQVVVLSGGEHRLDAVSTFPLDVDIAAMPGTQTAKSRSYRTTRPTVIGNDVWVGWGAMILGGAEVGDGAVIGARAVVRGRVPSYAIVVGNPARVVGYRFGPAVIAALLRIKWWEWPDAQIIARLDDFYGPITAFVAKYEVSEEVA